MQFRNLMIIGFIALIALLGAAWFFLRPSATVEFVIAPDTVTITEGNTTRTIKNGEQITYTPGTHKVTFSRGGFAATTKTITVTNKKTTKVLVALTPLTDEAKKELSSNPTSAAIVKQYQTQRYQELLATLPVSTTEFRLSACPAVKDPASALKALCVTSLDGDAKQAARTYLTNYDLDPDTIELLVGTEHIKTILKTDRYSVDYYPNAKIEGTTKKISLTITPLNVPYVAYNAPRNAQLEDIRTAALSDMKTKGYEPADYDIFYANVYLSRYNPDINSSPEHAMPPVQ